MPAPADHQGLAVEFCLFCHTPLEADAEAVPPVPDEATVEFCLGCHGPFESLGERTVDIAIGEEGVVGNPHVKVPHDSTVITKCGKCHETHALPLTSLDEIPQARTHFCFRSCHHTQDFTLCTECHDEDED